MKRQFFTKKQKISEKCNMTSVNLEKTLEYLRFKKGYGVKNFAE